VTNLNILTNQGKTSFEQHGIHPMVRETHYTLEHNDARALIDPRLPTIQFHEPKGVRRGEKIVFKMVRRMGRTLKSVYGWSGETFGCA
jgi:hypothetical protein